MQTCLDADTYTQLVLLELEHEFEQLIGYTAVHYLLNISPSFTVPIFFPSLFQRRGQLSAKRDHHAPRRITFRSTPPVTLRAR